MWIQRPRRSSNFLNMSFSGALKRCRGGSEVRHESSINVAKDNEQAELMNVS